MEQLSIAERVVLAEIAFLHSNGECFASNDHFARLLGCSPSNARKIVYKLTEHGVVVNVSKIGHHRRVLCPNVGTAHVQNWTPPCPKLDNITDKENTTPKPKPKREVFKRPNLDMVQLWFSENDAPTLAGAFFDYYESNGWVQGRGKPIRDWHAAARRWIRNQKQWNNEKRQRGFDKLKFDADTIRSWANDKNNGGNSSR